MKTINTLVNSLTALIFMTSFTNCATSNGLQQDPPKGIGEAYFQEWVAGVQGGGSGIDLHIPVVAELEEGKELDSVYFRGMVSKLEKNNENEIVYSGHFKTQHNTNNDIILSSDPKEEAKNKLPPIKIKMPFEVEDNECIVSYKQDGEIKYFVLKDLRQKAGKRYPQAPSKQ